MTAFSTSSGLRGDDDLDHALLERYWLGETSAAETAAVEAWLVAHPEWKGRYEQLRGGLKAGNWVALSEGEVNRAISQVLQTTKRAHSPTLVRGTAISTPVRGTIRRTIWYTVAGVAVLMVGWLSGVRRVSTTLSAHASMYATGNGERATITLPDGSTVILDVASRLQVPADYAAGNRVVRLTGEALFTVAHREGKPFTVLAGPSTTRVLGTRFVVRDYTTDTAATVSVQNGKVAVGFAAQQPTVLTEDEQLVVGPRGLGGVQRANPADFSVISGTLTLNDVPLPTAIPELDRWYDVDIRLGDVQVATKGVAGEFAAGSVADLIGILEGSMNVRVVRVGRVLTLNAR